MRLFIFFAPLLALAACASTEPAPQAVASAAPAASDAAGKQVCRRVQGLGELHSHTECSRPSEMSLDAERALQEAGRAQQAAHMHPVPGG
jgi:hypothetical protein